MCNALHRDSKRIPSYGTAYKLFLRNPKGKLVGYYNHSTYKPGICGWIDWNKKHSSNKKLTDWFSIWFTGSKTKYRRRDRFFRFLSTG